MSIFIGNGSCLRFEYTKDNSERFVKLAQDYNEGDTYISALDLNDNNQFKKFNVNAIQECTLLEEIVEYMPVWAMNALSDIPYGTVWSHGESRPDNTAKYTRLMEKDPFPLVKPIPQIVSNPNEPGVILKNGSKQVRMKISNRHDFQTGISAYVVTLDGVVYECPVSLAQAINSKLGL